MHYLLNPRWIGRPIRVLVVGAGGTGSELFEQLFRANLVSKMLGQHGLELILADGDKVGEFNLGRQRFWPVDLGRNKAEVLCERFNTWGDCKAQSINKFLSPKEVFNYRADIVITCIDNGKWRWKLYKVAQKDKEVIRQRSTLWLDCGNDRSSGQVILGHLQFDDCNIRLPNVGDLYPSLASSDDKDSDSCSAEEAIAKQDLGINTEIALQASGLLWALLREGKLRYHGAYVFRNELTVQPLKIDPEVWKLYGHGAH